MPYRLEPKLIQIFREGYSLAKFRADFAAGVIVGIIALPLAIAFAIASGVKPEQGLYTAIVAGFVISLFSGSRAQISGPTGAFIVVIYKIVQDFGYDGLAIATITAGFILVLMGLTGMGAVMRYIPYPLTIGFTSGIAVIIFSSQVKDLLGLHIDKLPADFVEKWLAYSEHFDSTNFWAVAVSFISLLIIIMWPKFFPRIPGSLAAIFGMTTLVWLFGIPVATIGGQFGDVPHSLPAPSIPVFEWDLFRKTISPAITIALLGAIESLLSAVVADGMLGTRHRPNTELIAQGIGNIVSPLFMGIPATGAIARTATNIKNGGRTPIAGMVHSLTLLATVYLFGGLARLIPMPVLAAILVYVAYNMSEWRTFIQIFKAPKSDITVLLITFLLTVFVDLTVAIEAGVVISAFLFIRKLESTSNIKSVTGEIDTSSVDPEDDDQIEDPYSIQRREVPADVEVFEITGPLFFAAVDRFNQAMQRIDRTPKVLILRMRQVPIVDASGLHAIEDFKTLIAKGKTNLVLSGLQPQVREVMEHAGLIEKLGPENVCENIDAALKRALALTGAAV